MLGIALSMKSQIFLLSKVGFQNIEVVYRLLLLVLGFAPESNCWKLTVADAGEDSLGCGEVGVSAVLDWRGVRGVTCSSEIVMLWNVFWTLDALNGFLVC